MIKRLTYQNIRDYVCSNETGNGCMLLTSESEFEQEKMLQNKNASLVKLKFQCKCGEIFETNFNKFKGKNKKQCNKCSRNKMGEGKRYTFQEINDFIKNNNCVLLTKTNDYVYGMQLEISCSCGDIFKTTFNMFKNHNKRQCDKCGREKIGRALRLKIEQVSEYINSHETGNGCKLISNSYIDNQTPLKVMCKCGEIYDVPFGNFQQGQKQCPECGNQKTRLARRLKYDDVKHFIEVESNSGCKLLSENYINNTSNMVLQCSCGKVFETSYSSFKDGNTRKCRECTNKDLRRKFSLTYETVQKYIQEYNCELLSSEYINAHEYLQIKCKKCGEIFQSSFFNFQKTKHKCPNCAIKSVTEIMSFNEEYVKEYIESYGYKLLSAYINCDTDLKLMCPDGHIFYMDFYHFKNRGQRCKICFKLSGRSGENSGTWKGGITKLERSMRAYIKDWSQDAMKETNYTCQITGKKGHLNVHHIYPFHKILEETLIELDLDLKQNIGDYTEEQREKMKLLIRQKHNDYDCSFVMLKDIHKLFHNIYGYKNTTKEQLEEFINNYKNGKYKN